jgi:hypothetical protein
LAATVGVDNNKYGFTELPVDDADLYHEIEYKEVASPIKPKKKIEEPIVEKTAE